MARERLFPPSVKPGIPKLGPKPQGWARVRFRDVLEVVERKAEIHDDVEYQLVTAKRNRGGIVPRERLRGSQILTNNQYYVKGGDFLISKRQIIHGACGVVPVELDGAIVSGEYMTLQARNELLPDFLRYYSHTIHFQQTVFYSSIGVDVEKMVFKEDQWLDLEVHLPPTNEQRKIAKIISAWDKGIEQTRKLIEAKTKLKKALMQELITNGIKSKEKRILKIMKIGDIADVATGGTPSRLNQRFWNGTIPWMSSGEIHQKRINQTREFVTEAGLNSSNARWFPERTVMIALNGQGKTRGTVAILETPVTCNQSLAGIIPNQDVLLPEFLFHYLDTKYTEIRHLTGPKARTGLNLDLIRKFKITIPSIKTQEVISSISSHFDKEIHLLEKQNDYLATQKNSLLQKLLTGKIRVKA